MAEKILVCDECGSLFRIDYAKGGEKTCPSCGSSKCDSLYRQYNIRY